MARVRRVHWKDSGGLFIVAQPSSREETDRRYRQEVDSRRRRVMTPRTSPISAASTFFYGPPDRRRRRAGRRQSQHPSPQPERPQRAQSWKASAVRGTSYATPVEVGIPSTELPSYRGRVRRKPILLALIVSAFFALNLPGASSSPPTLVAPVLSASVTGTEVSLTWTNAGGETSRPESPGPQSRSYAPIPCSTGIRGFPHQRPITISWSPSVSGIS